MFKEYLKNIKKYPVYLKIIVLFIIFIPLWWLLAVDQFVFPLGAAILLIIYLINYKKYNKPPLLFLTLLIFLIIVALSGLFIVEKIRYYIFGYQLIQYLSVGIIFFVIVQTLAKTRVFKSYRCCNIYCNFYFSLTWSYCNNF